MSLPRYAAYKESGIEWLGPIPRHWEIVRIKRVCKVFPSNVDKKSNDGEVPVRLCNYTDVYYNDRITGDLDFMSATATPEEIQKFSLRADDVIVTKDSETADDIAVAAHVKESLRGVVCGYHLSAYSGHCDQRFGGIPTTRPDHSDQSERSDAELRVSLA